MNTTATAPAAKPVEHPGATRLPVLRLSHARVGEILAQRAGTFPRVKDAIENDPALALNLFAAVNPVLAAHGKRPAADVARGILFFGMTELPHWLRDTKILEDELDAPQAASCSGILSRAHHAACQARAIATLKGGLNGDEVHAAALVQDGLDYVDALGAVAGGRFSRPMFACAVPAPPENPDVAQVTASCLDFGRRFAATTAACWDDSGLDGLYEEIAAFTGRPAADVARCLRLATLAGARAPHPFVVYPAVLHLMSPEPAAPRPAPAPEIAQRATRRPSPVKRSAPARALATALQRLAGAADDGATSTALLEIALETLREIAGVRVSALLLRDPAGTSLAVRALRGIELPAGIADVRIAIADQPLLARLLARESAFLWEPHEHARHVSALPRQLLGDDRGFLYSLHVNGKALGIIIGARPQHGADTAAGFAAFKRICRATGRALGVRRRQRSAAGS